jgi:hypothetical protein
MDGRPLSEIELGIGQRKQPVLLLGILLLASTGYISSFESRLLGTYTEDLSVVIMLERISRALILESKGC